MTDIIFGLLVALSYVYNVENAGVLATIIVGVIATSWIYMLKCTLVLYATMGELIKNPELKTKIEEMMKKRYEN